MYTERNVMISGTHTHSSPGGFMLDMLFDLTAYGFVRETFNAIVNGIAKVSSKQMLHVRHRFVQSEITITTTRPITFQSIGRAHDAVVPGRIFITHGQVSGANINRSPQAYLNNPKSERDK